MFSQPLVSRIAVAATLLVAGAAHAQVTVQDAWVRATVPQQKATGAFMRLTAAQDARLVSASSPVARPTIAATAASGRSPCRNRVEAADAPAYDASTTAQ